MQLFLILLTALALCIASIAADHRLDKLEKCATPGIFVCGAKLDTSQVKDLRRP